MRSSASYIVHAAVGCIAAAAVAACGVNQPPPGPGPVSMVGIPGDSLHKLATNAALWPVVQSAERACEGSILCWVPFGRRVKVDISADTGARNVSANPTVAGATLVGKFENTGKSTERRYNLTNGPYDFLLFVFPVSGGQQGRWVVERVAKAPVGGSYQHQTVAEGLYKGCGHPRTTYSQSFGEFRTCEMGPPDPPPAGVTRVSGSHKPAVHTAGLAAFSFVKAAILLLSEATDPAWFTCRAGCCVADPM